MDLVSLNGVLVFVVDDNPNNLSVIKDHLKLNGLKPVPLRSGEAAVELLETMTPDIILLDVQMGEGIDGFETCRRIKSKTKDIPVLFISAVSDTVNKIAGFDAGGVDYISKPIDAQELLSRIRVHITIKRLQSELLWINQTLEDKIIERTGTLIKTNALLHDEIENHRKTEQELKELQSFLSNILDSMPSMVLGVDRQGHINQWNRAAAEILEIPAKQSDGLSFFALCPQYKKNKSQLMNCFENSLPLEQIRTTAIRKGKTIYEELSIYPLVSDNKNGAVIRIEDITEKIMMQEMMIQNEKMLSTGGMAAGLAHEINNPLAGIMQTAKVMENRLGKKSIKANEDAAGELGITMDQIAAYLEKRKIFSMVTGIIDSSKRLSSIVKSMLGFVRKGDSNGSYMSMTEVLDSAVEIASLDYNIRHHYDFLSINIQREYEQGLPQVFCEKTKIQQVFLNLLHNAAQAMIKSGSANPTIILGLKKRGDGKSIEVKIQDNGPGMDEKIKKHIFEPFFTTKEPGQGTGLGLSVSNYIIVDQHKGQMEVFSRPGEGTVFIITIPISGGES